MQIVKRGLKKIIDGSIKSRLARILLAYRTTPHSTTGNTPAKLLLGQNLRTRLDLLKPNTAEHVENKQRSQKISHDNTIQSYPFADGQSVLVRVYGQNHKWTHGSILNSTGPLSYRVKLSDGSVCRHHKDQLREQQVPAQPQHLPITVPPDLLTIPPPMSSENLPTSASTVPRHYPLRTQRPPNKYQS